MGNPAEYVRGWTTSSKAWNTSAPCRTSLIFANLLWAVSAVIAEHSSSSSFHHCLVPEGVRYSQRQPVPATDWNPAFWLASTACDYPPRDLSPLQAETLVGAAYTCSFHWEAPRDREPSLPQLQLLLGTLPKTCEWPSWHLQSQVETAVQTSMAEAKREGEMRHDSLGAISGQLSNPHQDFNSSRNN